MAPGTRNAFGKSEVGFITARICQEMYQNSANYVYLHASRALIT